MFNRGSNGLLLLFSLCLYLPPIINPDMHIIIVHEAVYIRYSSIRNYLWYILNTEVRKITKTISFLSEKLSIIHMSIARDMCISHKCKPIKLFLCTNTIIRIIRMFWNDIALFISQNVYIYISHTLNLIKKPHST